jgi:hypothetical protein
MQIKIITTVEAAKRYGTSPSSISRAAKKADVGLRRADGRLVGLRERELVVLRKYLQFEPGNPNFHSPKRRKRRAGSSDAARENAGGIPKVRRDD